MIITRKIQLYVNCPKKQKAKYYEMLYDWRFKIIRASNLVASHKFTLDNLKDYLYLADTVKVRLEDEKKNEAGILNCSTQNTGYKVLSEKLKGDMPSAIFSGINTLVHKFYIAERNEYYAGKRSLRNYTRKLPIPLPKSVFYNLAKTDDTFTFNIFKGKKYSIPFGMAFGKDRSNNRLIVQRILDGEYKMSDSSLVIDDRKGKLFLLLCVNIPKQILKPEKGKVIQARLDIETPILYYLNGNEYKLGTKEEYLYRRTQIQEKLRNLQIQLKYARGGHGRKRKLQAIERFREKEKNYVKTKIHSYSAALVNMAVKSKCEKIQLIDQEIKEDEAHKEENKFLLRNWGYYGMIEKIGYKAAKYGIEVEKKSSLN